MSADRHRISPVTPVDTALETVILQLLEARADGATICPSEAARAVAASATASVLAGEDWRELMEPARAAAWRLVALGQVEVTQGGRVLPDPASLKGPIRIRRRRAGGA